MGKESEYIHKRHNVSVLMYHYVCPAKYRRVVVSEAVDETIKDACIEIEKRFDVRFLEIGADRDHVHFLIQTIPKNNPSQVIRIIKSLTAREVFAKHPEVKKKLWGGEFWSDGYYVTTVGKNANETVIAQYVHDQGKEKEYKKWHGRQLSMFELNMLD